MSAAVLLAALSALVWGAADYSGGRASRRAAATTAALAAEVAGLPVLAVCLLASPGVIRAADLAWGAAAGVAGVCGLMILYRGLAAGAMAVVAPVTGVTGAAVPVVVGLLTAAPPSALSLAGVGCAVAAIGLVSVGSESGSSDRTGQPSGRGRPARRPSRPPRRARTLRRVEQRRRLRSRSAAPALRFVGAALLAGVFFGFFFVLLDQTSDDSGFWPIAAVRVGSIGFGLLLVRVRREPLVPPRSVVGWLLVAGTGDILANALYLLALRDGVVTVVAPVAALYPVSTVLLALAVDRERVRPVQVGGLALAASALVLTAV